MGAYMKLSSSGNLQSAMQPITKMKLDLCARYEEECGVFRRWFVKSL